MPARTRGAEWRPPGLRGRRPTIPTSTGRSFATLPAETEWAGSRAGEEETAGMDWNGRKILVTGGAGFLGSNLCHALLERGARVTALDGFLFGGGANPANLEGVREGCAFELVRADIREIDLRPLCEGAAVIFNLAAQTSHMGGQKDPLADIAVNAVAQVRLIQAAREAAPDAVVVHASTRQFYGRPQWLPVDENHPV